jgi:hypothetical protein
MKNTIWALVAVVGLAAVGTTPAYAAGDSAWFCHLPVIGKLLCPPAPGGGNGGGPQSVPEPAEWAVLIAGAALVGVALVRRRMKIQK